MYLDFLTEHYEKNFFLELAYVVAIAKPCAEELKYKENSPLRGRPWPGLLFYSSRAQSKAQSEISLSYGTSVAKIKMLETFYTLMNNDGLLHYPMDGVIGKIEKVLTALDDIGMPFAENRNIVLSKAIKSIFEEQEEENKISLLKKKAILFELTLMVWADGGCSDYERTVLDYITSEFKVEKEITDEMLEISKELMALYKQGFEIITE